MRACVIVLDSVGCGAAPDAAAYGDTGANTLGHLYERCPWMTLPNLDSLGLARILGRDSQTPVRASYGRMREKSQGKDSTTGHWEIAGVVLEEPFAVYSRFPEELVAAIERDAQTRFLGNVVSSGTDVIQQLGAEHVRTGYPILYTSVDSVLQIAAHVDILSRERLYQICRTARDHADRYRIGRVIARPFEGTPSQFKRCAGRHDFSLPPPRTVLDSIRDAGLPVISVGKTADLFAGRGFSQAFDTASNAEGMAQTAEVWKDLREGLLFTNLVDFDTVYGHRRDPDGYARSLMEFDHWLGSFLPLVQRNDLLIITADHGTDPTFRGTDHTREEVPLIMFHVEHFADLGIRESFCDIAATLSMHLGIERWPRGKSLLRMGRSSVRRNAPAKAVSQYTHTRVPRW